MMAHKRLAVFVKNVHRGPFSFLMGALSLALTHTVKHHRNHLCKPWAETFRIRTKMTDVGPILGQLRCHVWPEISAKLVTKCTGNLTRNWNNVVPEVRPRSPEVAHQALAPCVARKWSGPTSVQFGPASVNFGPVSIRLRSISVRRKNSKNDEKTMTFSILGQLRSNFGPASVNFGPVSVRLGSGFGPLSVRFRSGFGAAV